MQISALERFDAKWESEPNRGCWLWTASKFPKGYGQFRVGQRNMGAHQFAFEHFKGPVPEGLEIDHLCRTRHCVNPYHLEAVTCQENLLRGDTINAKNAAKTYCPQGHPYDEDNTYHYRGTRGCLRCRRFRAREWHRNRKAA